MRLSILLTLLLAMFVASNTNLAYAEKTIKEADFRPTIFHSDNMRRNLRDGTRTADAEEKTADTDQEARMLGFSGLNKLKRLVQGNTKSVAAFQKNPAVIKEVESLKNSPAFLNGFKSVNKNGVMTGRLNSLQKHPAVVESLRKAPVEQSVKKMQNYLSRGQSRGISEETQAVLFFVALFVCVWRYNWSHWPSVSAS